MGNDNTLNVGIPVDAVRECERVRWTKAFPAPQMVAHILINRWLDQGESVSILKVVEHMGWGSTKARKFLKEVKHLRAPPTRSQHAANTPKTKKAVDLQAQPTRSQHAANTPKVDYQRVWNSLMGVYIDSGHSDQKLSLDIGDRKQTLIKCCGKLRGKDKEARDGALKLYHLFCYWVYGPNSFYRDNRKGSQIVSTLLKPTKVCGFYTESASWKRVETPIRDSSLKRIATKKELEVAMSNGLGEWLRDVDRKTNGDRQKLHRAWKKKINGYDESLADAMTIIGG